MHMQATIQRSEMHYRQELEHVVTFYITTCSMDISPNSAVCSRPMYDVSALSLCQTKAMHAACGNPLPWQLLPNSGMEQRLISSTGATQLAISKRDHVVKMGRALHAGAHAIKD